MNGVHLPIGKGERVLASLSELAVFIAVAEQGSFVGAGRVLGVSASAVGKRISGWRWIWACDCCNATPVHWR